jgi:hypothetical protein
MKTNKFLLVTAAVGFALMISGAALRGAEKISQTDRIRLDGQCLTVDGKDMFVFSGSFHYFRCPKELWRDRFQKIKDAGFNTVETYVAWNWHEREKPAGLKDFSKVDLTDLKDWLRMAHEEFGLYTIVRPGPYICAEWECGGFPRWLLTLKPEKPKRKVWLRSDDPVFLDWSKHWFDAVCPVLAAEQITHKPQGHAGTILFQIENEYDFWGDVPESGKIKHLKTLYKSARDNGIVVPIFTCWTREVRSQKDPLLRGAFDASNFYHRLNMNATATAMDELKKAQPEAPGMVAELQGGWFANVGKELSEDQPGIDYRQINAITLTSMLHGGTILNYYMLFGGTNFGAWGARGQTTTYDYNAPIRECGGVDAKYAAVFGIGKMLEKYGPALARAKLVPVNMEGGEQDVEISLLRGPQDQSFVFCRNASETENKKGTAVLHLESGPPINVAYDLGPFYFKVCYLAPGKTDTSQGRWMPERPAVSPRPAAPSSVRIATAWKKADPDVTQWLPLKPGDSLPDMGLYDARYVLYRSQFNLTPQQTQKFVNLAVDLFTNDNALVLVNDQIIVKSQQSEGTLYFNVANKLRPGGNEIVLLHCDLGHSNWGDSMESLSGLRYGALTPQEATTPLEDWRVKIVANESEGLKLAASQPDDSSWDHFLLDSQTLSELTGASQPGAEGPRWPAARILFDKKEVAVFQTSVDVTEALLRSKRIQLTFDRIDDRGIVLVNGQEVGKWDDWQKPFVVDIASKLKPGRNKIAVVLTNIKGEGGLTRAVRLSNPNVDGLDLQWELAPELGGAAAKWWSENLPDDDWTRVDLDTTGSLPRKGSAAPLAKAESLATWYRLDFQLPEKTPGVWVPWRALLEASGNGFLYLNGHPIGRYWEAGPQREYFLPECWLNFGPGKNNVLTLCLRPTEKGAELRAAEIAPYAEYAEKRK